MEQMEQIDQFEVPCGDEAYTCLVPNPWPTRLNPAYDPDDETECATTWAERHGLRYPRLDSFRPLLLAGFTLPRATPEGLRIAGRLNSFLIAHDDLYVDVSRPSLTMLRDLNRFYDRVLTDKPSPEQCSLHLARMLADVARGVADLGLDASAFDDALRAYFAENVRELERRMEGAGTDIAEYLAHRPTSGGVYIEFELSYLLNEVDVTPELRALDRFARLREAAAVHICMVNDCLSLPKELESGDTHNVMRIFEERDERGYQAAANRVFDEHLLPCTEAFGVEVEPLVAEAPDPDAARAAVDVFRDWAGGHICWELASERHEHSTTVFQSGPVGELRRGGERNVG